MHQVGETLEDCRRRYHIMRNIKSNSKYLALRTLALANLGDGCFIGLDGRKLPKLEKKNAYMEGHKARCIDNKGKEENPYDCLDFHHNLWKHGWTDANIKCKGV